MWVVKVDAAYWHRTNGCLTDSRREAMRYESRGLARYQASRLARGRAVRLVPRRRRAP
jgi:hypothetical protein